MHRLGLVGGAPGGVTRARRRFIGGGRVVFKGGLDTWKLLNARV